jgi:putative ABC transport system ATP-binding protein
MAENGLWVKEDPLRDALRESTENIMWDQHNPTRLSTGRKAAAEQTDHTRDILVARGVRKVYRREDVEVLALRGIDLTLTRGAFVAVTGPSGSGKTTLLQCLSGLDDIDEGFVTVAGENVHQLPEPRRAAQRARLMGFVFQSLNLLPVFTAVENVEIPLLLKGVSPKRARQEARAALDRVGLAHRYDHRPGELSGGEQQRVAVARALVGRPALMWADEPTGSLDTTAAAAVMDLLEELHAEGVTLVLVTHDPALAARAQRRTVLRDGLIVEDTGHGSASPQEGGMAR